MPPERPPAQDPSRRIFLKKGIVGGFLLLLGGTGLLALLPAALHDRILVSHMGIEL